MEINIFHTNHLFFRSCKISECKSCKCDPVLFLGHFFLQQAIQVRASLGPTFVIYFVHRPNIFIDIENIGNTFTLSSNFTTRI